MTRFACNRKQMEKANANENEKSKTHVEITGSVSLGPNVSMLYSSAMSEREGLPLLHGLFQKDEYVNLI